jgi:hypothetical protein
MAKKKLKGNYEIFDKVLEIIMENGFIIREKKLECSEMQTRATYDSFRIINLISDYLELGE